MPVTPDEDTEWTELVGATFGRVDLVKTGANGIPFLIAKSDGETGLLPTEFVRDLIAKQEPGASGRERVTMPSGVTLTGSPADIAAFIHKAAQRAADPQGVAKAKNDAADREHKATTGAAMPDGSYPIASEADLDKAVHAVGRGGSSHDAIRRHIISRARSLGAASKIPDNWNSDGSLKGDSVSKAETVSKNQGPDLDEGIDGLDPTVPLAAPEESAPGDPTDPGSPAWEAIDAATAQKWTSILARARVAVDLLSEREMLEAVSADPGDADNACGLQDVCCAIDYAISVLAPFAVAEQSEADCGTEQMQAIGKAMAADLGGPLAAIEGLAAVRKAGRVLSASNEAAIRSAAASLNRVLATLPAAPAADDVTKEKETAVAGTATETEQAAPVAKETGTAPEAEAVAKEHPGTGEPMRAVEHPADGTVSPPVSSDTQVAKDSSGPAAPVAKEGPDGLLAVYDCHGKLVGVVEPGQVVPVQGGPEGDSDAAPGDEAGDGDMDLTPAPAADAGTAADAVPGDDVAKETQDPQETTNGTTDAREVLKSLVAELVAAELGGRAPAEDIAKQADVAGLGDLVETLKGRVAALEEQPAAPKVFTNGATPPPHMMRGQDRPQGGAPAVDVAKAAELKNTLYRGTAPEQNQAATAMQGMAIEALSAIHGRR